MGLDNGDDDDGPDDDDDASSVGEKEEEDVDTSREDDESRLARLLSGVVRTNKVYGLSLGNRLPNANAAGPG
jgi:hypothetical protein